MQHESVSLPHSRGDLHANTPREVASGSLPGLSGVFQSPPTYRDLIGSMQPVVHARPPDYTPASVPPTESVPWQKNAAYVSHPAVRADVDRWPTDTEKADLLTRAESCSNEGPLVFNQEGIPLNPAGRTGLHGKGRLFFWGPNQAADTALICRDPATDVASVLLIQRANGTWAMPGGFIDTRESALLAAFRELGEEAIVNSATLEATFLNEATCIFSGYTADGRNTDNAWIETTVFVLEIAPEIKEQLALRARDDACAVRWAVLTPDVEAGLFSDHKHFIRSALARSAADPA